MWKFVLVFAVAVVYLSHGKAYGDIVYLQFSSSDAISGDIDGNSYSILSWDIELAVNDNVSDSVSDPEDGFFSNAITSGFLNLDGVVYEMAPSNFATTAVQLIDGSKASADVNFVTGVLDGGWVEFVSNNGVAFPAAFADNNLLNSATGISSGANTTINDWGYGGTIKFTQIATTTGEIIKITEQDLAGGTTFVNGSSTSLYAIPEPTGAALLFFLLSSMTLKRQRSMR
jgi:hypothetical protein